MRCKQTSPVGGPENLTDRFGPKICGQKTLPMVSERQHTPHCLPSETGPKRIPVYPRSRTLCQHLTGPALDFTQTQAEPSPLRDPSTPGDRRRYSAFLYSEYFCAAHRTDTLGCRSAILEHNPPWVAYLPLFPTLHAISRCHRALLLFLLLLYCYCKSIALSIPFRLS